MKVLRNIILFSIYIVSNYAFGQDRISGISKTLNELAQTSPGLRESVDLSVNDASLQEFIRALANTNNLNISIDPEINLKITSNFFGVSVKDVLVFICEHYDLDISVVGNIISVVKFHPPPPPIIEIMPKEIEVGYDSTTKYISYNLRGDSLYQFFKLLSKLTHENYTFPGEISNIKLDGFVNNLPLEAGLKQLAYSNNLTIERNEDDIFIISKKESSNTKENTNLKERVTGKQKKGGLNNGVTIRLLSDSLHFDIQCENISLTDVIASVFSTLSNNYFLASEVKGNTSLSLDSVSVDDILNYIFQGSDFTYKKSDEVYLIGNRDMEGLRGTEVFSFKYRTADKIMDFIPADLKKGVELKPFPDLNAIIMSGSNPRIDEIKAFFRSIDQVVPVIQIEVLIVEVRNTKTLSTGIEAGLKDKPTTSGGTVYPTYDYNMGASTINNLINGINGLGILNLGKVTSNFYLKIKALEQQGILKLKSTPKLATLNGHEAKLSIGRTEYYLEIQNSVVGVQNPYPVQSEQYKSVNADLSLEINPLVSADDQITLDIKVKQSNFTERISQNAPPGSITRDFQSLIRVKNEEMIILGGLDENSTNDSGDGIPLLSRIPVLKWLFSSRTKADSKNKLTIFIKPTVLY